MYPYYSTFLLPKQAEQVKQSMMENKGGTIHTRIGVNASNVKLKDNLWVCGDCIKEDMNAYGETYWHRVHQCPGVFICPKHEVVLEATVVSVKNFNQHGYIIANPMVEREKVNINGLKKDEVELLLEIAKLSFALLTNTHLQKTNNMLQQKYRELLKRKGYASPNGIVKRDRLYLSFGAKFSERCLEMLQSSVFFEETDWLTMIFQKHRRSFHPIRHILVMLYLDTDLDYLFGKEEYSLFGKGPWLCLNVSCPHYRNPVVKTLTITRCYDTGNPVGTFRCSCGFVFSRRGPDKNKTDCYRIGTIKDYGQVWKQKLIGLVNEGNTLTEVTKELHADPATIKKYSSELELKIPWKLLKVKKKS